MIRCSLAQWLLCVIPVLIPGVDSVDQWLQNVDRYRSGEQSLKTFHGFSMRLSASQLQLVTCRSCPTGWHDESPGIPAGPSWQHPHGSSYIDDNRMQASLTMHMQSRKFPQVYVCATFSPDTLDTVSPFDAKILADLSAALTFVFFLLFFSALDDLNADVHRLGRQNMCMCTYMTSVDLWACQAFRVWFASLQVGSIMLQCPKAMNGKILGSWRYRTVLEQNSLESIRVIHCSFRRCIPPACTLQQWPAREDPNVS